MTSERVLDFRDATGCRSFSLTIAFNDWTAKAYFQELEDVNCYRSRTCRHQFDVSAKDRFELVADQLIIKAIVVDPIVFQVKDLHLDCSVRHVCTNTLQLGQLSLDLVIDPVVDTRHRRENSWLESLAIVCQL